MTISILYMNYISAARRMVVHMMRDLNGNLFGEYRGIYQVCLKAAFSFVNGLPQTHKRELFFGALNILKKRLSSNLLRYFNA